MPAPCGECERPAADVPERPGPVDVGARVEDQLDEPQGAPARDRVVEAAALVHVSAALEEEAKALEVLEVDLVSNVVLRAGLPERLEQRGAAVLARVVDRVVVALGAVVDEQPHELRVVAIDGAPNGGEVPVDP